MTSTTTARIKSIQRPPSIPLREIDRALRAVAMAREQVSTVRKDLAKIEKGLFRKSGYHRTKQMRLKSSGAKATPSGKSN